MTAIEDARNELASYDAAIEDERQNPDIINRQDAPHLAFVLRALISELERVLAHPLVSTVNMNDSVVIEVQDEPTPPTDDEQEYKVLASFDDTGETWDETDVLPHLYAAVTRARLEQEREDAVTADRGQIGHATYRVLKRRKAGDWEEVPF